MSFLFFIGQCFYFMLPAYFANMTPLIAKKMRILDSLAFPIDRGRKFNGNPVLGNNKTLRGLLLGTAAGIGTAYFQLFLFSFDFFRDLSFVDYSSINLFLFGFLLGFGSLVGDIGESFIKRRFGKNPGESWIPWDQIDFVFGALIFILPVFIPSLFSAVTMIIVSFFWYFSANKVAQLLNLREET